MDGNTKKDVFVSENIGYLILDELKCIRKDIKEEMKVFCKKIEIIFEMKYGDQQTRADIAMNLPWSDHKYSDSFKTFKDCNSHVIESNSKVVNCDKLIQCDNQNLEIPAKQTTQHVAKSVDLSSTDSTDYFFADSEECEKSNIKVIKRQPIIKLLSKPREEVTAEKKNHNQLIETLVGQKLYKCQLCNKRYVKQGDLKRHMHSHTGERFHKCSHCGKTFIRHDHLTVHVRMHTGERPYQCKVCTKAFSRCGDLNVHLKRVHEGNKPFKCDLCEKAFVKKSDLKRHMKMHANRGPFTCDICFRVFTKLELFNQHVETHAVQDESMFEHETQGHGASVLDIIETNEVKLPIEYMPNMTKGDKSD